MINIRDKGNYRPKNKQKKASQWLCAAYISPPQWLIDFSCRAQVHAVTSVKTWPKVNLCHPSASLPCCFYGVWATSFLYSLWLCCGPHSGCKEPVWEWTALHFKAGWSGLCLVWSQQVCFIHQSAVDPQVSVFDVSKRADLVLVFFEWIDILIMMRKTNFDILSNKNKK